MKKYFFSLLFIAGLTLSFIQNNSFAVSKNNLSKNIVLQSDTPVVVKTIRARLGKTQFYIQKPEDCIMNVGGVTSNEGSYSISARKKLPHTLDGNCTIIIDQTYYSRNSFKKDQATFRDTVLGRAVTVKEYSKLVDIKNVAKGTEMIREFELAINGVFFWVRSCGFSAVELEKYYEVGRSLSN